ncbi:MAG: hypothetical protein DRN04_05375 [Thermoprotei archaeon]|nr:MAG: hypothetical protein DRN04_05375 [Thermoprotei archaeon]
MEEDLHLSALTCSKNTEFFRKLIKHVTLYAKFFFMKREPIIPSDKTPVHMVHRSEFDYLLANKANEAGADLLAKTPVEKVTIEKNYVEVSAKGKIFRGKVLVAADGYPSTVTRLLNAESKCLKHFGVSAELTDVGGNIEEEYSYFYFIGVPLGYCWVFPEKETVNIGFVADPDFVKKTMLRKYYQSTLSTQS